MPAPARPVLARTNTTKHAANMRNCSQTPSQTSAQTIRTCSLLPGLASHPPGLAVPAPFLLTRHSEIQSLTPSIFDYVKKYGRTYHGYQAGGKLCCPTPLRTPPANAP